MERTYLDRILSMDKITKLVYYPALNSHGGYTHCGVQMVADFIAYSGWLMTAIALAVAAFQTYRIKSLEKRKNEQLELFIEDANYVSFEHELIDVILDKTNDKTLNRYLISSHQRGCDLYRSLVDFYLSSKEKFTYDDLKRICGTPLVTYRWQENFWRGRIALRDENRNLDAPSEPFLLENKIRRYDSYQATLDARKASEGPNSS